MASVASDPLLSHQIWRKNQIFPSKNPSLGFLLIPCSGFCSNLRRSVVRAQTAVILVDSKGVLAPPPFEFDAVSEAELKERGFLGLRKTKLVCTVGPACSSLEQMEQLTLGGMNVMRLNMCHNTREWHRDVIRNVKRLNEDKRVLHFAYDGYRRESDASGQHWGCIVY